MILCSILCERIAHARKTYKDTYKGLNLRARIRLQALALANLVCVLIYRQYVSCMIHDYTIDMSVCIIRGL